MAAASELISEMSGGGTLDLHTSDQMIPYASIADGISTFKVREISSHLRTQIDLLPLFTGSDISVMDEAGVHRVVVFPNRT
jgi:RNA 3'-terminal phosphate cyclase